MAEETQDHNEQEASTEMKAKANFMSEVEPVKQFKKSRKLKITILVAVVFVVAIILVLLNSPKSHAPDESLVTTTETAQVQRKTISEDVERYSSSQFFLSFEHPTDWEVVDESRSGELTATSPLIDIPSGESIVSGKVVLRIKNNTSKYEEFETGNSTAVINSEKIKYLKPSSAQRGETYLSFLSYAGSASSSLIDGVYISGDFGYQKEQAIPKVDIQKIDPNISVVFLACDGTCDLPLSITPDAWASSQFGQRVKNILLSLTVN
jgi:hypothetical protein